MKEIRYRTKFANRFENVAKPFRKKSRQQTLVRCMLLLFMIVICRFGITWESAPSKEAPSTPASQSLEALQTLAELENKYRREDGLTVWQEDEDPYEHLHAKTDGTQAGGGESQTAPGVGGHTETHKVCYLTFDDGPSENTEKILDVLKEYQVPATFFLIGTNVGDDAGVLLTRMQEEGHAVGIHTYSHNYSEIYKNMDAFLSDYDKMAQLLRESYGIETNLCRFPGGSLYQGLRGKKDQLVEELARRGYACYDWTASGEDSVGNPSKELIVSHVFEDVFRYDSTIVLLHDSEINARTVEALPEIITRIAAEGYTFATLEGTEGYLFPW